MRPGCVTLKFQLHILRFARTDLCRDGALRHRTVLDMRCHSGLLSGTSALEMAIVKSPCAPSFRKEIALDILNVRQATRGWTTPQRDLITGGGIVTKQRGRGSILILPIRAELQLRRRTALRSRFHDGSEMVTGQVFRIDRSLPNGQRRRLLEHDITGSSDGGNAQGDAQGQY